MEKSHNPVTGVQEFYVGRMQIIIINFPDIKYELAKVGNYLKYMNI